MTRRTTVALVVFLVLLAGVYYLQSRPEKGQRRGERPRPLPQIAAGEVRSISLKSKGSEVVLERTGAGGWRLVKPVAYPADRFAAGALLERLEKLELGDIVTEQPGRHAELEVDEKSGVRVVVSGADGRLVAFFVGKVIDDFTMVRAEGSNQVYQAAGSIRPIVDRDLKLWRDRTIVSLKQDDVRRLELSSAAGRIALGRPASGGSWSVESSSVAVPVLDEEAVRASLAAIASLSAVDFADELTPGSAGTDTSAGMVVAGSADGSEIRLTLGPRGEAQYWAQRAGSQQIFLIAAHTAEALLRRPVDFRDKTVLQLDPEDVVALLIEKRSEKISVRLERKGERWYGDGKPVADAERIKSALVTLANLKAEGFAHHGRSELGLDVAAWLIEVRLKGRSPERLAVGSREQGGLYGLERRAEPEIFMLRRYVLERFLLEPANYK